MPTLSPLQAGNLAAGVYQLADKPPQDAIKDLNTAGLFNVTAASTFTASSGLGGWRPITGFGYVAEGINQFKDDAVIVVRGTDLFQDWLTDANFSLTQGTSSLIHTGFSSTWNHFAPAVHEFFRRKQRRYQRIHCIGHSLGGALATIAAVEVASYGAPELYTFGSPRVGLEGFAQQVTQTIGIDRIHRVAHIADPVTMVPLWPYVHAPANGACIEIGSGSFPINPMAHSINSSYVNGIGSHSWGSLGRTHNLPFQSRTSTREALNHHTRSLESIHPMTVNGLEALADAYDAISNFNAEGARRVAGSVSLAGLTALDRLAIAQQRATALRDETAVKVIQAKQQADKKIQSAQAKIGRELIEGYQRGATIQAEADQAYQQLVGAWLEAGAQFAGRGVNYAKELGARAQAEAISQAYRVIVRGVYAVARQATMNTK
jgi:triacylglycerol lipase